MNRKFSLLARLMALLLVFGASTSVFQSANAHIKIRDDGRPVRQSINTSGLVRAIVELESAPAIERMTSIMAAAKRDRRVNLESAEFLGYEAQVESEQANFKSRAALVSPGLRVRAEFRALANAVSIEATGAEVAAISALPGVKRVELVKEYYAALDASVPLINAPAAWTRLGGPTSAGEGMKIAILDTGIDVTNPLFSDAGYTAPSGFPKAGANNQSLVNNKVIAAKSFLPGNSSALDQNGHGTNVAGIAAGNFNTLSPLGLISGVAPRAFLGNYRVLDRGGSGPSDGIAAAVEEAVRDGFDVINLSLGSQAGNGLDFLSQTVESAVAAGRIVTIAAGNEGNGGDDDEATIASPGIAPSAITVAASTNAHLTGSRATAVLSVPDTDVAALKEVKSSRGIGAVNTFELDAPVGPVPYVDVSTLDSNARGCSGFPAGSLAGKVALIERGVCAFADKVNAADRAGAKAVIIFNKDISEGPDGGEDLFPISVDGTDILSVFVTRSVGLALKDWVRTHPSAQVAITPQQIGAVDVPADAVASFSARGPSSIGGLKPDLAAPGTNIYSGAINANNPDGVTDPSGFTPVQGTSQAAPHVAGAAAILKQLHPSWTPAEIKSALMNSATIDVFTSAAKDQRAGLLATGAGRVDLGQAAGVAATFAPASVSFGITKLKKKVSVSREVRITNKQSVTDVFTFSIAQLDPGEGVDVAITSATSFSLAPGQTATATISINAKKAAEKRHYTGYIVVNNSAGQTQRVPYWVRFKKKV